MYAVYDKWESLHIIVNLPHSLHSVFMLMKTETSVVMGFTIKTTVIYVL